MLSTCEATKLRKQFNQNGYDWEGQRVWADNFHFNPDYVKGTRKGIAYVQRNGDSNGTFGDWLHSGAFAS